MTLRLYQPAIALFTRYPLAAQPFADSKSAVMALVDGEDTYTLHWCRTGAPHPFITLLPWNGGDGELISDASGATTVRGSISPAEAESILARSTPFPRDGSLFGWVNEGRVTAVVSCYSDADEVDRPLFALMPRCDVPPSQWPPITTSAHPQFGEWFWEHVRSGGLVSLARLVASRPGTVFWVENATPLGTAICTVTQDAGSPGGYTLPAGYYAYYRAIQQGMPDPPSLVKRRPPGVDLASRFAPRWEMRIP